MIKLTMAASNSFLAFTADQFLYLGLEMRSNIKSSRWKTHKRSSQIADFITVYSVHPNALAEIWVDLHTTAFVADRIDENVTPEQLLIVYRWLNSYESTKELRTAFGHTETLIGEWCRKITNNLALLRKIKVCIIVIGCLECFLCCMDLKIFIFY